MQENLRISIMNKNLPMLREMNNKQKHNTAMNNKVQKHFQILMKNQKIMIKILIKNYNNPILNNINMNKTNKKDLI